MFILSILSPDSKEKAASSSPARFSVNFLLMKALVTDQPSAPNVLGKSSNSQSPKASSMAAARALSSFSVTI